GGTSTAAPARPLRASGAAPRSLPPFPYPGALSGRGAPMLERMADLSARIMEASGILVMLLGAVVALGPGARTRRLGGAVVYRAFREDLGKAILLGLELLVAADIIRTVSHIPTLEQVAVLGGIVLIRTFLSFAIQVELDGRLPWKRGP